MIFLDVIDKGETFSFDSRNPTSSGCIVFGSCCSCRPKTWRIKFDIEVKKKLIYFVIDVIFTTIGKVVIATISALYLLKVLGKRFANISVITIDIAGNKPIHIDLFKLNKFIISNSKDVVATPIATTDKFIHTIIVEIISSCFSSQYKKYLYNLLYFSFILLILEFVRLVIAVSAAEKNAAQNIKTIKMINFIIIVTI